MNIDALRFIDRWIGIPLCFALTLLAKMFGRKRKPGFAPRHILIIQLPEAGSIVLASPAVRRLRELHPEARVHFLVFERNREFLEILGLTDSPEDIWTLDDASPGRFLRSVFRFRRMARRRGIDATIDFDLFARASMILAWLSGARARTGFHNYRAEGLYRGDLLTHPVFYNVYKHISINFLALAHALGADPNEQPFPKAVLTADLSPPERRPAPERVGELRERVAALYPGLTDQTRVVILSPYSGNLLPIRAWPAENYVAFIRALLEKTSDLIVLAIGLPDARDYCGPIFEAVDSSRLVDFIGQTRDIGEVIDLFSLGDLFVAADSGPPHFASMTSIPTIVMFGPECPMLYGPLGPNVRTVYLGLGCSPCVSAFNHRDTPCQDNRCMSGIEPETILNMALDSLADSSGSG